MGPNRQSCSCWCGFWGVCSVVCCFLVHFGNSTAPERVCPQLLMHRRACAQLQHCAAAGALACRSASPASVQPLTVEQHQGTPLEYLCVCVYEVCSTWQHARHHTQLHTCSVSSCRLSPAQQLAHLPVLLLLSCRCTRCFCVGVGVCALFCAGGWLCRLGSAWLCHARGSSRGDLLRHQHTIYEN